MKKNKYLIIIGILVFILSMAGSYAYFAYQAENDSVIAGNIISIDAELTVERVVGTNEDMVPLINEALPNAINGVGSGTPCVDSQGNLSCQVYKISLINKGSRLKNVKGTIELYAKSGGTYTNLKWRELTDTTTVKDGSVINDMEKSVLVNGLTVPSRQTMTWYIAVWISEVDADQRLTDKGEFGGTVTFEAVSKTSTDFIEETLEENAVLDNVASTYVTASTGIDFAAASSDTNGKGIYLRSGTENDTYPIYYYRGAVEDNNLIFAGFCWKIVRTTETGGLKLIYNGTPTDGTCDNTDEASVVSALPFNINYNSPAYVGYMYGNPYTYTSKSMSSITDTYYYGNDVTYSNGTYTLTDTITSNSWSSIYISGLDNNHYTCFSTGKTCSEVYYIFQTNSNYAYYITLTGGKKVERALSEMLDYNTNSSTIKYFEYEGEVVEGTLEQWYATNIAPSYSSYIEDTIWCSDRSIAEKSGWNPDGGTMQDALYFSPIMRAMMGTPSLSCERDIDKFTASPANGNGDLDYPVGMLTSDEAILAGGVGGEGNTFYLNLPNYAYWLGSPAGFSVDFAGEFFVGGGDFFVDVVFECGVRPSVSLKPGFTIVDGGTGTVSNPYVVN